MFRSGSVFLSKSSALRINFPQNFMVRFSGSRPDPRSVSDRTSFSVSESLTSCGLMLFFDWLCDVTVLLVGDLRFFSDTSRNAGSRRGSDFDIPGIFEYSGPKTNQNFTSGLSISVFSGINGPLPSNYGSVNANKTPSFSVLSEIMALNPFLI